MRLSGSPFTDYLTKCRPDTKLRQLIIQHVKVQCKTVTDLQDLLIFHVCKIPATSDHLQVTFLAIAQQRRQDALLYLQPEMHVRDGSFSRVVYLCIS
jgi:hypothetical protein